MANKWDNKSELEKTVLAGIHGAPQLKKEERNRYLGFFRERVIQAVTFDQIKTKAGVAAITKALEDKSAYELIIHSNVRTYAMSCIVTAQKRGIDFTITSDPKFRGEVAVIVVSQSAVDVEQLLSDE